jgi:hypothetical protein
MRPLDLNFEKIINLSPVNPNKKLSNKNAEEDFTNNFKINLIDANLDSGIGDMSNPVSPNKENKDKLVRTQTYNNPKKNTPDKDGKYVALNLGGDMSPIHGVNYGREKNLNETILVPAEQDANKINESNVSREDKLRKKLNETLNFLNSKLIQLIYFNLRKFKT